MHGIADHSFDSHGARTGRRGAFTLVEVMMAAAIIGLGVLGLFAMFAGAARVQQSSSQLAASVQMSKNAESMLRPLLSGLVAPDAAILSGNDFQYNVWNQAFMTPAPYNYLTLGNPSNANQSVFTVVKNTAVLPLPMFTRSTASAGEALNYTASDIGALVGLGADFTFPERRIIPDDIVIRITYGTPDIAPPFAIQEIPPMEQELHRGSFPYPYDPDRPISVQERQVPNENSVLLYFDGDQLYRPGNPDPNYIRFDIEDTPSGTQTARFTDMRFAPVANNGINGTNFVIDKIEVVSTQYFWKNDNLASLNDRVSYRNDEKSPTGRIAQYSYSLLYRKILGTGSSQGAIFVYALQAPSSSAEWIPSEERSDLGTDRPPVQLITLNLAYDEDVDQYYFETSNEDDLWALAPQQILLVKSDVSNGEGLGADIPVRVVRRQQDPSDPSTWRGYIDRSPRVNNRSLLDSFTTNKDLDVYGVRDVVPSSADGSMWRLFPLNVQTFQIEN